MSTSLSELALPPNRMCALVHARSHPLLRMNLCLRQHGLSCRFFCRYHHETVCARYWADLLPSTYLS